MEKKDGKGIKSDSNLETEKVTPLTDGTPQPDFEDNHIKEYKKTFIAYFARLCEVLPAEEILPELVSSNVITMDEMGEIADEKSSREKVQVLLNGHIWKGISSGCLQIFTELLYVMRSIHNHECETLSDEICTKLKINTADISRE